MITAKNDDVLTFLPKEQIVESAYAALNTAFESWFTLGLPDPRANNKTIYERIEMGRLYCAAHPTDTQAAALLAELEGKAERARARYDEANHRYKLAVTNEEIKSI